MAYRLFILMLATAFSPLNILAAPVDTISVSSIAMKRPMHAVVIKPSIPPPAGGFPSLYLLHGFGGNYALWITKVPELQALADKYGCLMVCPDAGRATLYFDNPLDSNYRFETHFIRELIPYIEEHYPVNRERHFRTVAGLSMGGFGAFFFASRHPDLFGSAGSLSGVMNMETFAKYTTLSRSGIDSNCCTIQWKRFTGAAPVRLVMECGLQDYLLTANRNMHKQLQEWNIPHDYTERPGKHEWPYWRKAIEFQLLFFRRYWDEK